MNALEFAMQMEEDGRAYYEQLADETTLPGLETIFRNLAEDEQKHYEIFKRLLAGSGAEMQDSTALAGAQNVFKQLLKMPNLSGLEQNIAAYRYAMQLEAKSFRLYEDAAAKEEDAKARSLLIKIAAEEHKHFNILENICLFLEEPAQHPAWAESSGLAEIRDYNGD